MFQPLILASPDLSGSARLHPHTCTHTHTHTHTHARTHTHTPTKTQTTNTSHKDAKSAGVNYFLAYIYLLLSTRRLLLANGSLNPQANLLPQHGLFPRYMYAFNMTLTYTSMHTCLQYNMMSWDQISITAHVCLISWILFDKKL